MNRPGGSHCEIPTDRLHAFAVSSVSPTHLLATVVDDTALDRLGVLWATLVPVR